MKASIRDEYSLRVGAVHDSADDVLIADSSWYPLGGGLLGDTAGACFWTYEGQIHRCRAVGRPMELVFAQPGTRAAFCSSNRDGRMVAFSIRDERGDSTPKVSIVDFGDGTNRLVPGDGSGDRFPRFSPSSRWVSMVRQRTGEVGKQVWLAIYDMATDQCTVLPKATESSCVLSRCSWAIDADSIAYVQTRRSSSTIWVCHLPAGESRPVCATSGDVEALYWDKEHILVLAASGAELIATVDGSVVWRVNLPDGAFARRADGFVAKATHDHVLILDAEGTLWRLSRSGEIDPVVRSSRESRRVGHRRARP